MSTRVVGSLVWALALCGVAAAQEKLGQPRAAVVNGEVIPEAAVQRALKGVPQEHLAAARKEIVEHLIDHLLIEQHLVRMKIDAPKAEIEGRLKEVQKEITEQGQDLAKVLKELSLTEEELRQQIAADLRWENFVKQKANDQVLAELFKNNRDWFDGSQVRARHILVELPANADARAHDAARAKLAGIKKQIEAKVAQEMAKVDPKADALVREQAKQKALNDAFAEAAKGSDCPSKENGGDLGSFVRIGSMVEPFAKAAFALQPGQMSDLVETQFGCHLILVTARLPGRTGFGPAVSFDDMKDEVRDIYADRLRDQLLPQLRKTAKIEVPQPTQKP